MSLKFRAFALLVVTGATMAASVVGGQDGGPDARKHSEAAKESLRLAEQLKRNPPKSSNVEDPLRLFMLDRQDGSVTLVADEPDPGSNHIGSPRWSHDGKRILFDAMHGEEYQKLRLKMLECGDQKPKLTDLGDGASPAWSPDDRRIAFLLNSANDAKELTGIWVMEADGSKRRRAGEYGIPLWSPDGKTFVIVSFGEPRNVKVIETDTGQMLSLDGLGYRIRSWPSWAEPDALIAVTGTDQQSTGIAIIVVGREQRRLQRAVLWNRSPALDVTPSWPVYSAATRHCTFVAQSPQGMAIYEVARDQNAQPKRLEAGGFDQRIAGLSLSPDGRFLLFCSNRPVPPSQ